MNKMIPAACVALMLTTVAVPAAASEPMKAIVGSYLEIQAMLASDKVDGIKAPAKAIATQAEGMKDTGAEIAKAARAVEQAADISKAREAFGLLSNAVIAGAKAEGWKDLADVKLAYCPMAPNGSWLQKEQTIRNPYYGAQMLTCGSFQEKK